MTTFLLVWLLTGLLATTTDVVRRIIRVTWRCAPPGQRWLILRLLLPAFRPTPAQRRILVGNVLGGPVTAVGLWLIWRREAAP